MGDVYYPPEVRVSYAPGFSPLRMPTGPGDFVELVRGVPGSERSRLRALTMTRGRQDDLGTFEASTATLTLDNTDGWLDQALPGSATAGDLGAPLTPVSIEVIDTSPGAPGSGPLFTGFVADGWTPSANRRSRDQLVVVTLIDWLGWAATVDLPSSTWATWISTIHPRVWFQSLPPANVLLAGEGVINRGSLAVAGVVEGPQWIEAVQAIVDGETEAAWYQGTDTRIATTGSAPTSDTEWTVVLQFQTAAPSGSSRHLAMGRTGSTSGNIRWGVRLDASGSMTAYACNAGGTIVASVTIPGNHADGETHAVIAGFSATTMALTTDLGGGIAAVSGSVGGGGWLTTGRPQDPIDAIQDWAYAAGLHVPPQGLTPSKLAAWVDPGVDDEFWLLDTHQERLDHLAAIRDLDVTWDVHNADTSLLFRSYKAGGTLATQVGVVAAGTVGAAYVDRSGEVRVRDSFALTDNSSYYAPVVRLTDEPAPGPGLPVVRSSSSGRTGTRRDRVITEARLTWPFYSDVVQSRVRRALGAQARYGQIVASYDSDVQTLLSAADGILDDVLARFSDPPIELGKVTVEPWGDQAATTFVLAHLELERAVVYTEHAPYASAPVINRLCRVQAETWTWSGGIGWTVELTLAPASPRSPIAEATSMGGPIVGRGLRWPTSVAAGSTTAVHARTRHVVSRGCQTIAPVFGNYSSAGATQPVKVRWSLDREGVWPVSGSSSVVLGHFDGEDGSRDITIAPGTEVVATPIAGPFRAGDVVWINTRVTPVGTSAIPVAASATRFHAGTTGEVGMVDTAGSPGDYTASLAYPPGATSGFDVDVYGPLALVGDTGIWVPSWGVLGDSIAWSFNDSPDYPTDSGWVARLFHGRRGVLHAAVSGQTAFNWLADPDRIRLSAAADCWIDAMGRNDLNGQPLDDIKSQHQQIWNALRTRGVKVIVAVLPPPKTTSTDGWTTTGNQTVATPGGAAADYVAWCTWLLAQVGVAGGIDHVLDQRSACGIETAPDNWVWRPGLTTDGTHPSKDGHVAIAAAAAQQLATWEAY